MPAPPHAVADHIHLSAGYLKGTKAFSGILRRFRVHSIVHGEVSVGGAIVVRRVDDGERRVERFHLFKEG